MENEQLPALEALKADQTQQRSSKPLNEGLEGTSAASEPLSATTTSIPFGTARAAVSDAPRVDQALESVLKQKDDPYVEPREQLVALRDEVESLRYRATDNVRNRIRRNPWQSVGLAAVVGFIVGVTR